MPSTPHSQTSPSDGHQHQWQSVFCYKFCKCGASELTEAGRELRDQKAREFAELFSQ